VVGLVFLWWIVVWVDFLRVKTMGWFLLWVVLLEDFLRVRVRVRVRVILPAKSLCGGMGLLHGVVGTRWRRQPSSPPFF
jgi:hypothetical protein